MEPLWWMVFALAMGCAALSLRLYVKLTNLRASSHGRLEHAQAEVARLSEANEKLAREKEDAVRQAFQFEKRAELAKQALDEIDAKMRDFEAHRAEMTKAVKASLHETGTQLAGKLLEDHKREAEEKRKQQEEQVRKHSEKLLETVGVMQQELAKRAGQMESWGKQTELMMRAITSPGGGGQLAEQSLENFLTSMGLVKNQDFFTQWSIESEEARLRPDVVIFLPGGRLIVIDSKTSKFLIDLAEAEGTSNIETLLVSLRNTMHKHLRDLSMKHYEEAVVRELKKHGRMERITDITSIMYVPTETAIERIRQADPDFLAKAREKKIMLLSPSGLYAILSQVGREFDAARLTANHERIVELLPDMLESFATALGYVGDVQSSIRKAGKSLNDFARSLNSRLLPRVNKLQDLGIKPAKNKTLPRYIPTFEIHESADPSLIEGEAENIAEPARLMAKAEA